MGQTSLNGNKVRIFKEAIVGLFGVTISELDPLN
jgi:hypothetical protein